MEIQRAQPSQNNLETILKKKLKVGGLVLPDFKIYYKTAVINTVQ